MHAVAFNHMHASLTRTRTCKHADQSTKVYPCPRSCWHDAAGTRTLATVSPAPFPSWPHLPVARDHAQHSATPTPCRTRRITAYRCASRCRPPARRSAPAAPRTRSYSVVKTQRPRRPLPGLVASAVKHSAAPGRTCSAAPPTPAYKRRCRALHSGHPVPATARKSPHSRSALTAALSSLSSSSL